MAKDANLKYIWHIHREGFWNVDASASIKNGLVRVSLVIYCRVKDTRGELESSQTEVSSSLIRWDSTVFETEITD